VSQLAIEDGDADGFGDGVRVDMMGSIQRTGRGEMSWYHYIAVFFAGMFLANAVPHFVQGVSGERFPTPFSKPPGEGLSSPTVNVVWALFNVGVGYLLFRVGRVWGGGDLALGVFFVGMVAISVMLSVNFAKKDTK
jgi:hypothetical protein